MTEQPVASTGSFQGAAPGAREGAKYAKGCELLFWMYGSLIFDGRQFQDAHSANHNPHRQQFRNVELLRELRAFA
jgi:hypothetical protein